MNQLSRQGAAEECSRHSSGISEHEAAPAAFLTQQTHHSAACTIGSPRTTQIPATTEGIPSGRRTVSTTAEPLNGLQDRINCPLDVVNSALDQCGRQTIGNADVPNFGNDTGNGSNVEVPHASPFSVLRGERLIFSKEKLISHFGMHYACLYSCPQHADQANRRLPTVESSIRIRTDWEILAMQSSQSTSQQCLSINDPLSARILEETDAKEYFRL